MILPSDDNSTPEKKPGKPKSGSGNPSPGQDDDDLPANLHWNPGEIFASSYSSNTDEDEDDNLFDSTYEIDSSLISPEEWREQLREELIGAIEDLKNFPDPDTDFDPPDPPDLYSFYSELLAMRKELRKAHGETLKKLNKPSVTIQLAEIAGELKAKGETALAARIIELLER
jgi:hypothetical protein